MRATTHRRAVRGHLCGHQRVNRSLEPPAIERDDLVAVAQVEKADSHAAVSEVGEELPFCREGLW